MDSVGSTYREESVKGLTFGTAVIRKDFIDIDGYSNKKTEAGMLKDLAKAVRQYSKSEADGLLDLIKFDEIVQTHPDKSVGAAQYILEWEDVPGASQYNEETDEHEYADGRWYVHMRFIR